MAEMLRPSNAVSEAGVSTLTDILTSSSSTLSPSRDVTSYLTHLTDLPLSELECEPTVLSSSSAQLTNALTTLCHTSYPTFLSLRSSTSTLSSSLSSLSSSLEALISSLPSLESSVRSFTFGTREIQKERRKAALVLEHHDKLYDVLSLPVLLDSCVRNHNYTEALLLANHSTNLAARFPSNPLVQSVKAECDARVQAMLGQLLRMLSEQAKLPALFRAVGFLRKMEVLEEEELALAFLTGRATYLEGILQTVEVQKYDKEACARYLKRYVDLWRECVYDVVTQYTTIFLDRAPSTSTSTTTHLHSLLTTFASLRLQTLLSLLQETLPVIADPSLLTSLLTQLTYCANSFARVGMDFKELLAPLFVDAVRRGVTKELENAANGWCDLLKSSSPPYLVASAALVAPPLPSQIQLQALVSGPANVPPPILISYPPLATYTNAVLTALNGLRLMAPVELLDDLSSSLEDALARGGAALLEFARKRKGKLGEKDKKELDRLRAAGTIYVTIFVPFLRRALVEGVYGVVMADVDMPTGKDLADVLREWDVWLDGEADSKTALAPDANGR
ncbi:Dor1-domain-containing protein [Sparassis crispa]|uniref:Conserved oligomeric Golgi complex subunit 8 n=1 Tax=Sparassis crispa TaxID=139825 RepID=A0A401G5A4_9APHY|nr:Dor1-domain-containing protein [Sparassis crispa]GBE77340.1 Dor1-domain-containing protein [Sparassis crispa]